MFPQHPCPWSSRASLCFCYCSVLGQPFPHPPHPSPPLPTFFGFSHFSWREAGRRWWQRCRMAIGRQWPQKAPRPGFWPLCLPTASAFGPLPLSRAGQSTPSLAPLSPLEARVTRPAGQWGGSCAGPGSVGMSEGESSRWLWGVGSLHVLCLCDP